MVVLLLALVAVAFAAAAPEKRPCQAPLPQGPSVPAPIVFKTSCGAFRLAPGGEISRLPPRWFLARRGGTSRRYGADLRIQRNRPGRIVLLRRGRVVWRSSDLYPRDAGDIAFGPHAFAFASYRRGIFLSDLRSPERLILRGAALFPIAFLRDGTLLVIEPGLAPSIRVVARDGSVLRRYRYRAQNGYQFDEHSDSLFFVTPARMLVRADRTAVHVLRPLRGLDGWISFAGPHLTLSDEDRLAVLGRDGTLLSRWTWRRSKKWRLDLSPVASDDGRTFAYRTVTQGLRGTVVLYLLREGAKRATAVYRHRGAQVGCGVGASFGWHGRFLL